jgi:hypothetical protein
MENILLNNKLEYITNFNKQNRNVNINKNQKEFVVNNNIDWMSINKQDQLEIKKYLHEYLNEANQKSNYLVISKFEMLDKKLKVLKLYGNLAIFTISIKYLDMVFKVKYGGKYFFKSF